MKKFKLIWKLICYNPRAYLLDGFIWTMFHSSQLLFGLITREFFDTLSNHARIDVGIWGLVILLIIVAASQIGLIFWGAPIDIVLRFKISALVRRNLLERIMEYPGAKPLTYSSGEVINRFRDDAEQIEDAISWTLDVIGCGVFAIASISVLLSINAKITLFVFTPLVIVVIAARSASSKLEEYRNRSRVASDAVTGAIGEVFGAVQAVQLAGAEDHIVEHFKELNDNRRKQAVKDSLLTESLNLIFENTVSLGTGLILLLSAQAMSVGSFSVGDFALFAFCLTFVTDFTSFFGSFLSEYQQTGVSLTRIIELMEDAPDDRLVKHNSLYINEEIPEAISPMKQEKHRLDKLEIKGLTYTYQGGANGIKDVTFDIERGSFTIIAGRIGSGKSTLVKTLLGLLKAEAGSIYWNGEEIKDTTSFFLPPYSAYTSQIPNLFSDTLKNNILLGLPEKQVNLKKASESAVLERDLEEMGNGFETVVGPNGVKVSGGQLQRIAVARMFARDPELLVLDDISSALDSTTENTLWDRILCRENQTYIVVSNHKVSLQKADHIIVMKNGCIESQGTLEWLLENSQEMKNIWGL